VAAKTYEFYMKLGEWAAPMPLGSKVAEPA
jgi:hypothetical protein